MTIRKRVVIRAVALASLTGAVLAPAVMLAAEAIGGNVHLGETVVGCWLGTAFFAISGVTAAIFQDSRHLRGAVLTTYVVKTLVLAMIALSGAPTSIDRTVFGVSVAVSAVAYLVVQTMLITRRNARFQRLKADRNA